MSINESRRVNVGDTIVTNNMMGEKFYKITRVTKTLAFSSVKYGERIVEHKFKRLIGFNMAHPYQGHNTTSYSVIKGEECND